jgi:HEPN domain-containing protein
MPQPISRSQFVKLAELRLQDARMLLDMRRYAAAYYLAGYAAECALKACIARRFRANVIPDKNMVRDVYDHSLEKLLRLAELESAFERAMSLDPELAANWNTAKDWNPDIRYQVRVAAKTAKDLFDAMAEANHGVLQWLKRHW